MIENISIVGITPLDHYPCRESLTSCKQCLGIDNVSIPRQKPSIESIIEIKVSICVEEYRLLNTILGPKVIISGVKRIKIIYTALNCEQSIHSAHWEIPFYEFVLIKDLCFNECETGLNSVFIGIEDVDINYYNERYIEIAILFIICPNIIYNKNQNHCIAQNKCEHERPKCEHEKPKREYERPKGYTISKNSNNNNSINSNTYYFPIDHYR